MTIGIIGAGAIGQALARQARRAGYDAVIANRRGPASLSTLAGELGATPGTVAEAAAADLVALAVPWTAVPDVAAGSDWSGRIVIDTTNPITIPGFQLIDLGSRTSSEVIAGLLPGARLVKAANTLSAAILAADPTEDGGRRVLTLAGDDAGAKAAAAAFFDAAGFATIDLGALVAGGRLQQVPDGAFRSLNLLQLA